MPRLRSQAESAQGMGGSEKLDYGAPLRSDLLQVRLFFYLGVPGMTAMLFGMNQAGMARVLPSYWAIPYWLGITIPLWALLDASSRFVHILFRALDPHRWLVLVGGALIAMALFGPYLSIYARAFGAALPPGTSYRVNTPFPEAFLDLRKFAAYSGVPIYWVVIALFFARSFGFPPYLARSAAASPLPERVAVPDVQTGPVLNEFGLEQRSGFRALLPYHLGCDVISLSAEDHYIRVITARGNALIRYRFGDALKEVRGQPGIQAHRSHWVAIEAIERVRSDSRGHVLILKDGSEVKVSRTNVGVLKAAGLV